jgi:hypothetical protein
MISITAIATRCCLMLIDAEMPILIDFAIFTTADASASSAGVKRFQPTAPPLTPSASIGLGL